MKLAQDYCHKEFVEERKQPLPHWCVIHAPDHHNDPRNVHMHIVFAERPAKRMIHPETGKECWDFEIQIKIRDGNKHNRLCRPFEQNTDRSINSAHWVKKARHDFATLANQALAAAGKPKIYDPRTYTAMGITEKARERINGKDYVKEKRGESTAAGDKAIAAQWEREEIRLAKRHATFGAPKKMLNSFDVEIARWTHAPNSVAMHLRVHRHEYSVAVALARMMKAEKAANAFVLAKIQSKILPPLQAKDEDALEAQDFLRLYKLDIVDRHDEKIEACRETIKRCTTALARAQKANPRTTEDSGFLTGRGALVLPGPDELTVAKSRVGQPMEQVYEDWRSGRMIDVAEQRTMRKAVLEQMAARQGEIVYSDDQSVNKRMEARQAQHERDTGVTKPPLSPDAQKISDSVIAEATSILKDHRAQPGAAPLASPIPTQEIDGKKRIDPRVPLDANDRYATNVRSIVGQLSEAMPNTVAAARVELPKEKVKYGDEIAIAFMSETGDPIQRRIYSPMWIRSADEQAAAVAAAIEKRRAERAAKNRAELDALRVANPEAFLEAAAAAQAAAKRTSASPAEARSAGDGLDRGPTASPDAVAQPILDPGAAGSATRADAVVRGRNSAEREAAASPSPNATYGRATPPDPPRPRDNSPPVPRTPAEGLDRSRQEGAPTAPSEPTVTGNEAREPQGAPDTPQGPTAEGNQQASKAKKKVLTAEELRRRALLAARNRGRGR